jgi:hypothetical protein
MKGPRVFTVEEANAALPRLRVLIAQQMERAAELERGAEQRDVAESETLFRAYQDGWREVEAMGVVVKDPRIGLCDFYGHVDGRLVWLCWKYGEETVAHYHDLDTGFAGRKPLEGAPTRALLN